MIRRTKPKTTLDDAKLELARIDRMLAAIRPQANKGDTAAIATVLTLGNERAAIAATVRRLESLARLAQIEDDEEDDDYYA